MVDEGEIGGGVRVPMRRGAARGALRGRGAIPGRTMDQAPSNSVQREARGLGLRGGDREHFRTSESPD